MWMIDESRSTTRLKIKKFTLAAVAIHVYIEHDLIESLGKRGCFINKEERRKEK